MHTWGHGFIFYFCQILPSHTWLWTEFADVLCWCLPGPVLVWILALRDAEAQDTSQGRPSRSCDDSLVPMHLRKEAG